MIVRWPIPYLRSHVIRSAADGVRLIPRGNVLLCKAKVRKADVTLLGQKDVLGFQVPVHNVQGVKMLEGEDQLSGVKLRDLVGEPTLLVEVEEQIATREIPKK